MAEKGGITDREFDRLIKLYENKHCLKRKIDGE
jgi:hypothetical protein